MYDQKVVDAWTEEYYKDWKPGNEFILEIGMCLNQQRTQGDFYFNDLIKIADINQKQYLKSINIKIPYWVLKELIDEKKGWVQEAIDTKEDIVPYEKWIIDKLSKKCV